MGFLVQLGDKISTATLEASPGSEKRTQTQTIRTRSGCSEDILIHDHDHAHHGINVQPKHAKKQPMTRYRDPNIMNPTCQPGKSKRTQPRKSKLLRQVLASLACLLGQEVWKAMVSDVSRRGRLGDNILW